MPPLPKPIQHGTVSGYVNHKCHCDKCREAWRVYNRKRRAERYAYTKAHGLPRTVKHGSPAAYNQWGCNCDVCSIGHMIYNRRYYKKKAA